MAWGVTCASIKGTWRSFLLALSRACFSRSRWYTSKFEINPAVESNLFEIEISYQFVIREG